MTNRFVCVFNRDRDDYQVPLGLHEAGLLECLVTDYYAADPPPNWLPNGLARRRASGLPKAKTISSRSSFGLQMVGRLLRIPAHNIFRRSDRLLAEAAGREAERRGAGLYCYHDYIPDRIDRASPLIVFAYHPLASTEISVLSPDADRFPEVRAEFEAECARMELRKQTLDWDRVDAVVCASDFTKHSIIADGCAAEKIAVIPYGAPTRVDSSPLQSNPDDPVRFLFVGQGIQRKGLHHLIHAWQSKPRGTARLTLVCYHIGPEIRALIRDQSINLLGYQDRAALDELYRRSQVFVMPSLVEGFGLVYLDALAHGCHVIGTPNTGLPNLNLTKSTATLVNSGDLVGLSSAIDDLILHASTLDRGEIRRAGTLWRQSDFRKAIGEHVRGVLGDRSMAAQLDCRSPDQLAAAK